MKRTPIPGCWYLDSLTNGKYAGILPLQKVVATHKGIVPYPPDEPLWLAMTDVPVLRFMGQGHNGTGTWEWTEGSGWTLAEAACGVWCVIYGRNGERYIAKCEPPTGSQGYRYVTIQNQVVYGDLTIALLNGLNEWTDISINQDRSLLGGQGHEGEGACVWSNGKLRLLHPGECFNIRCKYDPAADIIVISFYDVEADGICGWVYELSLQEFLTLPEVVSPTPKPPEPPNPEPPNPEPPNPEPPNPEPPKPEPIIKTLIRLEKSMENSIVAIRSISGKFGRPNVAGTGPFGDQGWHGILFDRDTPDDDCRFELSKPDDFYKFRHLKIDGMLGIDAAHGLATATNQFYLKPGSDRGAYESISVYVSPQTGKYVAFVENFLPDLYPSAAFQVVVL